MKCPLHWEFGEGVDSATGVATIVVCRRNSSCNSQKNPRVRKILVRNSGARNGCANFMDAWKKNVRSAGKAMSIKFLVLGEGGILGFFGGGGVLILFLWAREFF